MLKTCTAAMIALFSLSSYASDQHTFVIPDCLLKKTNLSYQILAQKNSFTLATLAESQIDTLIALKNANRECGGVMDVTGAKENSALSAESFLQQYIPTPKLIRHVSYRIQYQKEVNALIAQMNPDDMWNDLSTLVTYPDRYARSKNGVAAANSIQTAVETMAANNHRDDVTVYTVATGKDYLQPSVVAKIGNSSEPGVVIGGHMDTLNGYFGVRPGADDDGTGTSTVLEAARVLLGSGMHFKKPIYLVWYAAEEEGLVGSQYVVADFKAKKIPVAAVLQLDMTGYENANDPTIWLISDYVNQDLTTYLKTLIDTYVKQPVKLTRCGYACSDHATWTQNGFTAAMPFESAFGKDDPYIHTSQDTMNVLSRDHMADFEKLALAFAVELAEPVAG